MAHRPHLTKSRFITGLQCHRRLWWQVQEPDAPELKPDPLTQSVFDRGTRVGELARTYFPDGVLIPQVGVSLAARADATKRAIDAGARVIFEAAFLHDDLYAAIDVLTFDDDGGARIHEVKSTTHLKPEHLGDVAVQTHVARSAGVRVTAVEVMHLNSACSYPDLSNLFVHADVTAEVENRLATIPPEASRQLAMLAGPLPDVPVGDHCSKPYPCPFFERCAPEQHEHDVSTLYAIRASRVAKLRREGMETVLDLSERTELTDVQHRQRVAVQSSQVVVVPGLKNALDEMLLAPVAYLDFETVALAVPIWNGCHPYEQVPAQWSIHLVHADGSVEQHGWIATAAGDPRAACARSLASVLPRARTVVAYNAPFEKRCLEQLAKCAPDVADTLLSSAANIRDLLPVVKKHVYHPDFGGKFGLKSVLPALVDGLGYEDLEIAEGATAALRLEQLVTDSLPAAEGRESIMHQLLAYCSRDTEALVALAKSLERLANRDA